MCFEHSKVCNMSKIKVIIPLNDLFTGQPYLECNNYPCFPQKCANYDPSLEPDLPLKFRGVIWRFQIIPARYEHFIIYHCQSSSPLFKIKDSLE